MTDAPAPIRGATARSTRAIAGVDGCPAGWLCIAERGGTLRATVHATAAALLHAQRDAVVVAIDVPIGLADAGPRACDVEARRLLGPRRSSVFPAPVRAALDARDYREACALGVAADGRGLSRQTHAILPRIREVDALLRADADARARTWEVHPELSFRLWNDGVPMADAKRTEGGLDARRALAERAFPGAYDAARGAFRRSAVADDDILDALAALWTARRIDAGVAVAVPADRPHDARGLRMYIVA